MPRIAVVVGLCLSAFLVAGATSVHADQGYKGLVGITCLWVDGSGAGMSGDSFAVVTRNHLRDRIPTLKIDPDCPDTLYFEVDSVATPSRDAVAVAYELSVRRSVYLASNLSAESQPIRATVWSREQIQVVRAGVGGEKELSNSIKTVLDDLFGKFEDDYRLAGNK